MRASVRTEGPISQADLSHVEERARLALERFRPRVARATLRLRRIGPGELAVELSVPLGTAGTVRIRGRGACARSCAEDVIGRAVEAITLRLRSERQELLEFLLVAGGGWSAAPRGGRRRTGGRTGRGGNGKAPGASATEVAA